ncbi:MAG: efflux RND transporter periplasmic adaptor subunit, partial [bacterium]|nr:efflux RND transporter periplasmic adaptor subunit [bacterium]
MKQKKIIMVIAILFVGTLAALGAIRQSGPGEKPFARIGHETTELGHDHGASDPHAGHEHGAEEHHQEPQRTIEAHDDHGGHDHDTEEDHGHEGHHHAAGEECNDGEICPEHLVAEIEDALCRSEHISQLMPGEGLKVRLASLEAAERAGIVTSEPVPISRAGGMELPGRVGFNRNRLARISPLASGIVQQVFVQPGTAVEKDQVLAEIATPEIAALKAQLLSAQARRSQTRETFLREKDLLERGITSRQEFLEAQAEYRSADSAVDQFRQQLSNYGLSQR